MVGNHLVAFYLLSLEWKLYLRILELSVEGTSLSWANYIWDAKNFIEPYSFHGFALPSHVFSWL